MLASNQVITPACLYQLVSLRPTAGHIIETFFTDLEIWLNTSAHEYINKRFLSLKFIVVIRHSNNLSIVNTLNVIYSVDNEQPSSLSFKCNVSILM
jgi:hypothetical protein